MNINEKMHSVLEYVRDSTNPYTRLVHSAMSADRQGVPFYQMDEVREASFHSDNACEMIMKALASRLEDKSAVVVSKALSILRVLMVEGANGIRVRMARAQGSLHRIANMHGVLSCTLEASNRDLAAALLQAMEGKSEALISFSTSRAGERELTDEATATNPHTHKSEFRVMHEREQRLYRRRCEEDRRQSAAVVLERVYGTFDGGVTPERLVAQLFENPKKKFAPAELDSFLSAAAGTGRLSEVCAVLDQELRCGRQSLQNRYKVLQVAERLVSASAEAREYFRENGAGIRRHVDMTSAENPVKAEVAQSTARRIAQALVQTPQQLSLLLSSSPAATAKATAGTDASRVVRPPQPSTGFELDDLFSDLPVKMKKTAPAAAIALFSPPQVSSSQQISGAAMIEDMFSPSPPQRQHEQKQLNDDSILPPFKTMHTEGVDVSYVPQLFDWNQPEQKEQQLTSSLWSMPHDVAPSLGSHGSMGPQLDITPRNTSQEMSVAMGEPQSQQISSSGVSNEQLSLNAPSDTNKSRLMQEIQAQMEVTRQMLEQQQSVFLALQTELWR